MIRNRKFVLKRLMNKVFHITNIYFEYVHINFYIKIVLSSGPYLALLLLSRGYLTDALCD